MRPRSPGQTEAAGGPVPAPRAANFPPSLGARLARLAQGSPGRKRADTARPLPLRPGAGRVLLTRRLSSGGGSSSSGGGEGAALQLFRARRASWGGGGRGARGARGGRHGAQQHTAASSAVELVGVQDVQHRERGGARRWAGPGRTSPLGRRGHCVAGGERRGSGPGKGGQLGAPVHGVPGGGGGRRRCGPRTGPGRRRRQRGAVPGSHRAARAHAGVPPLRPLGPRRLLVSHPGRPGSRRTVSRRRPPLCSLSVPRPALGRCCLALPPPPPQAPAAPGPRIYGDPAGGAHAPTRRTHVRPQAAAGLRRPR